MVVGSDERTLPLQAGSLAPITSIPGFRGLGFRGLGFWGGLGCGGLGVWVWSREVKFRLRGSGGFSGPSFSRP